MSDRQSGRTTQQMREAPKNAIFVAAGRIRYSIDLARHIGRPDLQVVSWDWILSKGWQGRSEIIVIDHAIPLEPVRDWRAVEAVLSDIEAYNLRRQQHEERADD